MPNADELTTAAHHARRERRLGEAKQLYIAAAQAYAALHMPLREAHSLRHAADILSDEKLWTEALPYYERALKLYRQHEPPALELANALRGFALLNGETGARSEALGQWREARQLYEAAEVQAGIDEADAQIRLLTGH